MSVTIHANGESRFKTLSRLAWPAILEQLLATMVSYVDTAMVGSMGAVASAAVGLNAPVVWLLNSINQGVGIGYSVLVAQAIGAKEEQRARHTIVQSVLAILVCGLALLVAMLALGGVIPRWLGAEPDVLPHAAAYLRIYALSLPFGASLAIMGAIVRCMGNAKLPLILNTAANLTNIVFNTLLIYPTREVTLSLPFLNGSKTFTVWGAGMGVEGAAIATSISIAVAGGWMMLSMFVRKDDFRLHLRENWQPDRDLIRRCAGLGLPYMAERLSINLGQLATTRIISSLGTVAVAANHIAVTAEGMCYLPAYGISYAATTLVGQSVGAGDLEGAKKYGVLSGWYGFLLCAVTGTALFAFATPLASLFNKDPEVVRMAALVLRIVAPSEPMFALFITLGGALRGAGDTRFPMFLCLGCMWGVRVLLTPILVYGFGVGLEGVWLAMALDLVARGAGCALRWKRERWMRYGRSLH